MKLINIEGLTSFLAQCKKLFATKSELSSKLGVNDSAASAKKLSSPVNINGVSFDGTKSITVTAQANGGNSTTVNGHTVLSNVPANAVFTDTNTTYSASTGLSLSGTAFSVKYGSVAGTACQGNDTRLSNARPANGGTSASCSSASTGLSLSGTAFSVKYGSVAGTACQGNDTRLSNARPANGGTSASCSGNSATATKLQTARTINGVSFDGTGNISISAPANGGTSASCSGNSATATKLATGRTINGIAFDGTKNIIIPPMLPTNVPANGGTSASCSGNSATATKLATGRTINGIAFDGTKNIIIPPMLPTNVVIEGTLTVKGSILSNDNVTAYSDKRLKENIEIIKNPLDRISLIHGYLYNFIDTPDVQRTGLIAQELQKVLPQAVKTVKHEKYGNVLAINYGETVGLLFEGMREIISENKKLKAEIEELKLKIK